MPRYYPNNLFTDCWSSVGNITFFHRNGLCYWKTKPLPVFPGTSAQLSQLNIHRRAIAAWKNVPGLQKELWNRYALDVPAHKPPFTEYNHISGYNLFISAYHNFAILGDEKTPKPKPFINFPEFVMEFCKAERVGEFGLKMVFKLFADARFSIDGYAVLAKLQLCEIGKGSNPGKMKNVPASDVVLISEPDLFSLGVYEVSFLIEDYRSFSGLDLDSYSVHMRYLLIDRVRGYRSQYLKLSSKAAL